MNINEQLVERYPKLLPSMPAIEEAIKRLIRCFESGGKLLTCGNGGSAADAEHIVGELMKGFLCKRPLSEERVWEMQQYNPDLPAGMTDRLQGALPAIALTGAPPLTTAFANDVDPEMVFAQQLYGYARNGDVLLAISTSGNAKNVLAAAQVAHALGVTVMALTGASGGLLREAADVLIAVPEMETYRVQELHLPVYHAICAAVEAYFFAE